MDRDIVFVDTSVYVAENFFSPNSRINSLVGLAEKGIISLISTEITENEVLRHFKEETSLAWNNIKNSHRVFACFDDTRKFLRKNTKKEFWEKCEDIFKKFKEKSKIYTIGYDYCDDVKSVFIRYFNAEKPFNEGKKKYEFPDAFTLQMLERYCTRNSLKQIIILSNDKDMKDYRSEHLKPINYKEYITSKLAEAETIEKINQAIKEDKERICSHIQIRLEEELYDNRNYSNLFNTEELPEVEIQECTIDMDANISIISKDKNAFLIELYFNSYCEVKCTYFNLDYAVYDREDKIWYGGEWETETLKGDESFKVLVSFKDDDSNLNIESFDVTEAIPSFTH